MNDASSPYSVSNNMQTFTPHRPSRTSISQPAHSYRVEKPRSSHNSPRTVERRKTTTGAKLYATLDDHYNMMMGITPDEPTFEDEPTTARPMSWHPSSTQFDTQRHSTFHHSRNTSHNPSTWSRTSGHGSDFYSLSSRNLMSVESSQHYPAHAPGWEANWEAHRSSQASDSSRHTRQSYATSSYSTPATEPMPWYLQEWARRAQDQAVASRNGSSEFLPIQHSAEPEDEQMDATMDDSGKELIGMGLYDLPDSSLDWMSPVGEATGKGLKLEETWQPPEEDEDEDGEDEDEDEGEDEGEEVDQDDDASSVDGEEDLPPPPPVLVASTNHDKTNQARNLEGQSFFFDEDDSVSKEWWYQHLRQPSIPVRDTGYGYGWL
ncbi:hypothetical protein GRF29_28g942195 [Pseudopithomyces chartarum]|uniref:Uncharacterized protein n=1 Tax=Pseudopithomyces chartarum TaxID=1892770 RepID=A0AAN6LZR3_9PLEO|nr:hypothetical protein GRF29_28g942195 [Pseudopithomyces chartarum]